MPVSYTHLDVYKRQHGTSEVTKALEVAYETNPPPATRGHAPKLRFAHPAGLNPPTFVVHGTRLKSCLLYTSRCV